jgi:hypothetical protein
VEDKTLKLWRENKKVSSIFMKSELGRKVYLFILQYWSLKLGPLPLNPHLQHFLFDSFFRKGLFFSQGMASDQNPPTFTSCIAGITGVYHHAWPGRIFHKTQKTLSIKEKTASLTHKS